jgi:AraC-like DNA-binding protein
MMDQVLIYRFVHLITAVKGRDRFNFLHIAVPVILATLLVASVPLIPSETRLEILYNADGNFDNPLYSVLNKISGIVFIVYNILYPVLGLARIRRYRRAIVNYSADTQRTSLNWLTILQILTLLTIPVPLAGMLLNMAVFSNFWTSIQGVLPTFFVYPLLCYNLLSDNYEIMTSTGDESLPLPDQITGDESFSGKSSAIDPKRFDKYLKDKQPYLNPKIHITDFASALQTNTKYVSACINNRYKMNFSSFINSLRLEELERLRKSTQMQSHDNMDIILMSGFSNYRSYLRAKKTQDRAKLLKI